jgi:hypothetical protein
MGDRMWHLPPTHWVLVENMSTDFTMCDDTSAPSAFIARARTSPPVGDVCTGQCGHRHGNHGGTSVQFGDGEPLDNVLIVCQHALSRSEYSSTSRISLFDVVASDNDFSKVIGGDALCLAACSSLQCENTHTRRACNNFAPAERAHTCSPPVLVSSITHSSESRRRDVGSDAPCTFDSRKPSMKVVCAQLAQSAHRHS